VAEGHARNFNYHPNPAIHSIKTIFLLIFKATYMTPAESRFFIDFSSQFVLSRNHKGPERLILGGSRHFAGNRQVGQQALDLRGPMSVGAFCHETEYTA
jgi:hypothetical protein